jgi:hypothetical protein
MKEGLNISGCEEVMEAEKMILSDESTKGEMKVSGDGVS